MTTESNIQGRSRVARVIVEALIHPSMHANPGVFERDFVGFLALCVKRKKKLPCIFFFPTLARPRTPQPRYPGILLLTQWGRSRTRWSPCSRRQPGHPWPWCPEKGSRELDERREAGYTLSDCDWTVGGKKIRHGKNPCCFYHPVDIENTLSPAIC